MPLHPLSEGDWRKATILDVLVAIVHRTELDFLGFALFVDRAGLAVGVLSDLATAGGVETAVLLDGAAAGVVDVVGHVGEGYLGALDVVVGDLEAGLDDSRLLGAHPSPHQGFNLRRVDGFSLVELEDFPVDDGELGERLASEDFERHVERLRDLRL